VVPLLIFQLLAGIWLLPVAEARPYRLQDSFNVKELAEYRLTVPVWKQFASASRLLVTAMLAEPRLAADPLFTRDVLVLDDVVAAAGRMEARLKFEPRYAAALRIASLPPREYTKFAIALFAARLAHGFVQSGALRRAPAGVPGENVAFVAAHEAEVVELLRTLGVEGR
jgi:hypothetical protein